VNAIDAPLDPGQFAQQEFTQLWFLGQPRMETLQELLTFLQGFQLGDKKSFEIILANCCATHEAPPARLLALKFGIAKPHGLLVCNYSSRIWSIGICHKEE
jgi:hypothetical protein